MNEIFNINLEKGPDPVWLEHLPISGFTTVKRLTDLHALAPSMYPIVARSCLSGDTVVYVNGNKSIAIQRKLSWRFRYSEFPELDRAVIETALRKSGQ